MMMIIVIIVIINIIIITIIIMTTVLTGIIIVITITVDACMSAFHGRAWGLEADVAAHVQWSEAAGKNKLTAYEVNDIRGMLQVRGLLPPPIYVCICVCTHSYTNINTGTQTRKSLITLPLCVAIYMHLQSAK